MPKRILQGVVVSDKKTGTPYVEVKDLGQLYATIDAMKKP